MHLSLPQKPSPNENILFFYERRHVAHPHICQGPTQNKEGPTTQEECPLDPLTTATRAVRHPCHPHRQKKNVLQMDFLLAPLDENTCLELSSSSSFNLFNIRIFERKEALEIAHILRQANENLEKKWRIFDYPIYFKEWEKQSEALFSMSNVNCIRELLYKYPTAKLCILFLKWFIHFWRKEKCKGLVALSAQKTHLFSPRFRCLLS